MPTHREARRPEPSPIARSARAAITRTGLTITQFSGVCGVPRTSLSLWLNGRRHLTVPKLERVLRALDRRLLAEVCELIETAGPVRRAAPQVRTRRRTGRGGDSAG